MKKALPSALDQADETRDVCRRAQGVDPTFSNYIWRTDVRTTDYALDFWDG